MSTTAKDWLADLLEVLFEFIADDKCLRQSGLLTSCLCVSPRWRDIGVRSLWTHIALTSEQLEAFVSVPAPSNYILIKSLTLRVVPLRPFPNVWLHAEAHTRPNWRRPAEWATDGSPVTRAFWNSLERFQSCLSMMVELQTVSFYVTSSTSRPVGYWLRNCDVLQLLASLPSKVENLELDTKGTEVLEKRNNLHVLRSPSESRSCVRFVFDFAIREIVINLLFPTFGNGTMECIAGQHEQSYQVATNLRRTLIEKMLAMKDESHTASAMLVLDSSAVSEVDSDGKFFVESDNYVYDRWLLNTINRYDVLANNTSSEPLIGGWGSNKEIRHFNDRSQLDEDISGKFVNLEEMIEGNTWVQTTKGLRLPRSCLPRRRRVAVEQPVLELNAMRADYEENGFGSPDHALLLNEDKAGRPLVATRRTPGLGDVEPLRRKEVDEEPFDAETEYMDWQEPPYNY